MKPSVWNVPEPTTVSSAIWFHCATVFPGGSAAAASRVVPADAAKASATAALTGFVGFALAPAAGRSDAARRPSAAATRRRLFAGRPGETLAMRRWLCGTNEVMGSPFRWEDEPPRLLSPCDVRRIFERRCSGLVRAIL